MRPLLRLCLPLASLGLLLSACSQKPSTESTASAPDASTTASSPAAPPAASAGEPITIGYSDWPGFIAKETAGMKELARQGGIKEE